MNQLNIANNVKYFRSKSGLSQLQLAKIAGVGKTVIFDIEKGKQTIQLDTLLKVFDALNIKIELITPFQQIEDEK